MPGLMPGFGPEAKIDVTVQQHPICFVSGLLMCKLAHIAGRFRASAALLNSYGSGLLLLLR